MSPAETIRPSAAWFPPTERHVVRPDPRPDVLRLICLPFAGGTASAYRGWQEALGETTAVVAPQLPGRGTRLDEEPYSEAAPLIADLATVLVEHGLIDDYAFFGHSMGALLAYELACELRERGMPEPRHLFVSASRAPHLHGDRSDHALTDTQLRDFVRDLGGLDVAGTVGTAYFERRLPVLRADLRVCDTYQWRPRPPLNCPMTAFSATGDPIASVPQMEAWRAYTGSSFLRRHHPGGHFFLNEEPQRTRLLRDIRDELSRPEAVRHSAPKTAMT
ncbi:alpha/beta fold hydrolase [Streptomyces sp. NPDC050439]|uniref:thioesterase II family protein n=1 Tax=unclassified Streptomyces TaxID=2593676 RepID=UPI00341584F3